MEDGAFVPLTAREIECIDLSRYFDSSKELAKELGVSKRTVDFHLQNAYAKLGVRSKLRAIYVAEDLRLIGVRKRIVKETE